MMTTLHLDHKNIVKTGEWLALFSLMLLALWLRWQNLTFYPVNEDELMSLKAVKAIFSSGVPRIGEGGTIYWRALLPHYLMAFPLFFAEATVSAARIVPTLFSILVIPVAYAGGRLLSGRTAGWLAAAFLAFSNYQNYHAAFARFYMPFQFFFLVTALLAGTYFVLGRQKHGLWLLLATLATLTSHALAVSILPLLALAFLCGQRWTLLRSWSFWGAGLLVAVFTWVNIFWAPEQVFVNTMSVRLIMGGLANKLAFYETFRTYLPLGWTLIFLGALPVCWSRSRLWMYLWSGFFAEMIFISLVAPDPNVRYMCHLFSYGVVLAAASLCWSVENFLKQIRGGRWAWPRQTLMIGGAIIVGAACHLVFAENLDKSTAFGRTLTSHDQKPAHQFMAKLLKPEDLIISMEPGMTVYFLDRPANYWLREEFDPVNRSFSPYSPAIKKDNSDFYIDSPERLQEVLSNTRQRIWVYLNQKTLITTSKPMRDLMEKNFTTVYSNDKMKNFVLVRY